MSQPKPGRPEAAALIWDWKSSSEQHVSLATGRQRIVGTLQSLVGAGIGGLVYLYGSQLLGSVILSIATLILLSALLSPAGLYAGIQNTFTVLGRGVGRLVTWIVMLALFYLFFTPFGLLFRRKTRDRLQRFYEPDAETYWKEPQAMGAASSSATRQF